MNLLPRRRERRCAPNSRTLKRITGAGSRAGQHGLRMVPEPLYLGIQVTPREPSCCARRQAGPCHPITESGPDGANLNITIVGNTGRRQFIPRPIWRIQTRHPPRDAAESRGTEVPPGTPRPWKFQAPGKSRCTMIPRFLPKARLFPNDSRPTRHRPNRHRPGGTIPARRNDSGPANRPRPGTTGTASALLAAHWPVRVTPSTPAPSRLPGYSM
jgi:hypothetical protein